MSSKFPLAVALSEKFLWEVLLTDKWHKSFIRDIAGRDYFLFDLSFCPTQRYWRDDHQIDGDDKVVAYVEPSTTSTVIIGMRREYIEEKELWYPNSISMDILILSKKKPYIGLTRFLSFPTKIQF